MSTPPTPMGSGGLLRYRSAPSSYLVSLLSSPTRDLGGDFAQPFHPSATDTQRIFSRLIDASSSSPPPENCPTLARHTSLPDGFFDGGMGVYQGLDDCMDEFLKGLVDEEQRGKVAVPLLCHHRSLPPENKDSVVPCKIRAKRGCATHPRSIAERVRRTKISERMRKLQELVPNMDKQTNTSDMLDFAVDYIKDLQRQVKTLSDDRAKCSCSCSKTAGDQ